MCFAAYVSTRNFTCLRDRNHLLSHWLNVGRTLTQSISRFFERQQHNSANRKDSDPYGHVTGTCRHVIERHCRTDNQYDNRCTAVVIEHLNWRGRFMYYRLTPGALLTGCDAGRHKAQGPTKCPIEGRALRGPRAL